MVLDATTMTGVLSLATDVLTWMLTSAGSILTFMTTNPIILLFVIVALVFIAVGLVRKFI